MVSSKLKVLHIIPSLAKGGAERLVIDICEELILREDVDVKLVVLSSVNEYNSILDRVNPVHVKSKVALSIFGKNEIEISEFEKIVNEYKPNVIHSHLFEAEILSRIKIFEGVKYVSHAHSNIPQLVKPSIKTFFSKRLFANYFERSIVLKQYKNCKNSFITISKDTDKYLKNNLPKDFDRRIYQLDNAIDFDNFKGVSKSIGSEIKLLTVGSLVKKKNQIFLLDVLKCLVDKNINATLDILGDGPERESINKRINYLGINNAVSLRGKVDDVKAYYEDSLIYLHSAIKEPFGLVIVEAMASGLPCVCIDGKGNRNLIKEGENGYLVNEYNVELFAEKILHLISDREQYSNMSENCINFSKEYDIKPYVDKLIEIYKS